MDAAWSVLPGAALASLLYTLSFPAPERDDAEVKTAPNLPRPVPVAVGSHAEALATLGLQRFDQMHIVHPYAPMNPSATALPLIVDSAKGVRLHLRDGRVVVDGISSWWACIHGYAQPEIDAAITAQLARMSHVMFGGLTHQPAAELCARLLDMVPGSGKLCKVFLCDSGSIAVEVAMKMAMQYWRPTARRRFLTLTQGYHGDTFGAMSVCDPVGGMHHLFKGTLAEQVFIPAPQCETRACTDSACTCDTLAHARRVLSEDETIAAVILEPLFQGAGGMHFFSAEVLRGMRALCTEFKVLLIADEIATGFGRTGDLFACKGAGVVPDIMCVGKGLTGGYVTMGATLCTQAVADRVGTLMHGPTFMANPLACAAAVASLNRLVSSPWQARVHRVEALLREGLAPLQSHPAVERVSVKGAIGVVALKVEWTPESKAAFTARALDEGAWLRPFGNVVYTMPPFNAPLEDGDVRLICNALCEGVRFVFRDFAPQPALPQQPAATTADPVTFV